MYVPSTLPTSLSAWPSVVVGLPSSWQDSGNSSAVTHLALRLDAWTKSLSAMCLTIRAGIHFVRCFLALFRPDILARIRNHGCLRQCTQTRVQRCPWNLSHYLVHCHIPIHVRKSIISQSCFTTDTNLGAGSQQSVPIWHLSDYFHSSLSHSCCWPSVCPTASANCRALIRVHASGAFMDSASTTKAGGVFGILTAFIAYYAGASTLITRDTACVCLLFSTTLKRRLVLVVYL